MLTVSVSLDSALNVSALLFAIATLYLALEYRMLAGSGLFARGGILDWEILSLVRRWTAFAWPAKHLAYLYSPPVFRRLCLLQAFLAACVACGVVVHSQRLIGICCGAIFAIGLLLAVRHPFGRDGADEMSNLVAFGLAVAFLSPTTRLRVMAALFICGQLVLSYVVAGVAKLRSRAWMTQGVLAGILGTEIYGRGQPFGAWLRRHPKLDLLAGIGVVFVESAAPAIFIVPDYVAYVWISVFLLFHVGTAVLMGLNTFLLAFSSALPLLWWLVGV